MFTFEKAIPESTGISSDAIKNVLATLDKKNVPMHSLLIMRDDKLIFEKYYAPYTATTLHRLFSVSKSITAMAIALLQEEGKLSFDESITAYFPEYTDESTHPWIRMTTIRNMLQMRTCHASTTYKVDMKSDWVESFFKVAPTNKPGTVFHYDTSAAHTLCALAEKLSGMSMLDYLKDRAFKYLDFSEDSYMVKDPFGVSMGGSGLMATPMDLLKILYLLYKEGTVTCSDGKVRSLLPKEFVKEATSNISDSLPTAPLPSEAQGYGMQIWQNEKGGFVLYGMGGQLGICIPDKELLIVTTADTQGMAGGNQIIYDALYDNLLGSSSADDDGKRAYEDLLAYADTLKIAPPRLPENYGYTCSGPKSGSYEALKHSYSLDDNPQGFDKIAVNIRKEGASSLTFTYRDKNKASSLPDNALTLYFGINDMVNGTFPIYDCNYTAGGVFLRKNVLYIRFHLIGESVGSVRFELYFGDDDLTIFMKKVEETYFKEFDGHLYGC